MKEEIKLGKIEETDIEDMEEPEDHEWLSREEDEEGLLW